MLMSTSPASAGGSGCTKNALRHLFTARRTAAINNYYRHASALPLVWSFRGNPFFRGSAGLCPKKIWVPICRLRRPKMAGKTQPKTACPHLPLTKHKQHPLVRELCNRRSACWKLTAASTAVSPMHAERVPAMEAEA